MILPHEYGYAVITPDMDGVVMTNTSKEICIDYCTSDYVIVEMIPQVCGFRITIRWHRYHELIRFQNRNNNILWLHWTWAKEYRHKIGKVVYRPNEIK